MVQGNSCPLLGCPSFMKSKSGQLTLQGKKRPPEKKKRLFEKDSSCYDATLMQTQQSEERMSILLFCFSFFFFPAYPFSDNITRELMEALSWNFLNNKMVSLPNYFNPNAVLLPKQENLAAIFLSLNSSSSPSVLSK